MLCADTGGIHVQSGSLVLAIELLVALHQQMNSFFGLIKDQFRNTGMNAHLQVMKVVACSVGIAVVNFRLVGILVLDLVEGMQCSLGCLSPKPSTVNPFSLSLSMACKVN